LHVGFFWEEKTLKIKSTFCLLFLGAIMLLSSCGLGKDEDSFLFSSTNSAHSSNTGIASEPNEDITKQQFAMNFPSYEEVAEQYPDKTVLVWTIGETGYDYGEGAMRTKEINEYLDAAGKDFAVCFYPVIYDHYYGSGGSYTDKIKEMISAGTPPDIIYTHAVSVLEGYINPYVKCVIENFFEPLDNYLENTEYGREMYALMPEKHWDGLRVNGTVYGVDGGMNTLSFNYGYYVNAELAERYNFNILLPVSEQIDILKAVKESEKDCDVFSMYTDNLYDPSFFSAIKDISHAVYWDANSHTAKCAFDETNFYEKLQLFSELSLNKLLNNMGQKNSDTFFIMQSNKTGGSVIYEDAQTVEVDYFGNKVNSIPVFSEPLYIRHSSSATGICSMSENKDKAFELLALTQTDRYLNNLLSFGIEGKDYSLDGDTVIETKNYFNPGRFGNYMLCHLWERNDVTAEQYRAIFETAQVPSDVDFIFDSTAVHDEFVASANIMDTFSLPTANGEIGFDERIAITREQLEEIGMQKIIDECNRQYKVYKNENN